MKPEEAHLEETRVFLVFDSRISAPRCFEWVVEGTVRNRVSLTKSRNSVMSECNERASGKACASRKST